MSSADEREETEGVWALPTAVGRGIGGIGRILTSAFFFLPHALRGATHTGLRRRVGAPPGIEFAHEVNTPPEPDTILIRVSDFGPNWLETFEADDVQDLFDHPRPEWATTRWVNIDGLHPYVVNRLREHYGIHTLAAEDVVHVPQRPKYEATEAYLFFVARMISLRDNCLSVEQISLFEFDGLVLSFQQRPGDIWSDVRERLTRPTSRLRLHGAPSLFHALIDSIVDHCFPLLERYGDHFETLELEIIDRPTPETLRELHMAKRDLALVRRALWPLRDAIGALYRDETPLVPAEVRTFYRDVHDHTMQAIDVIETFREFAVELTDLYMSAVSNRMNEIMKVLTIMTSVFIPVTFLAGVYGMNFTHIPELNWRYAYPTFWGVCLTVIALLLVYFYRKGWIGR